MKRASSIAAAVVLVLLIVPASPAAADTYPDQTLTGGFQTGHFDKVWDLTEGDMTLSFTYDGTGLVDDAGAHAWAELGVRTAAPGATDFNPYFSGTVYGPYAATIDLLAGKDLADVGDVIVGSDATNLYVTYRLDAGWCMTQSHFAVATEPSDLPQTSKGNAIPGQFPYGESYSPCASGDVALDAIPFAEIADWAPGVPLFFAAHAVVWDMDSAASIPLVSDTSVNVTSFNGVAQAPAAAVPAFEPVGYQNCGLYQLSPATGSVWDTQNGGSASNDTGGPFDGALWIWRTNNPVYPDAGEYATFEKTFNLPGPPASGSILITADNGYIVSLNGTELGSAQIHAAFPGSLKEDGVDTTNWQTPETWNLPLVSGDNTLSIVAANEFAYPGDVPNQQTTGIGGTAGGLCPNPGGLIFKADVSYYARSATAWGEGDGFDGKDWSMYFSAEPTEITVNGSGVWFSADYDWTPNTFDPDVTPSLDLDDKLMLQRQSGAGEAAYDLPSVPPVPGNNHRFWWDRDGVDPWQNPATANTGGTYEVVITLHATSATTGTAFMTIEGLSQGFEVDGNWSTIELTPAGMTFGGDMTNLQVFYGLFGYDGATHSASFTDITVTQ